MKFEYFFALILFQGSPSSNVLKSSKALEVPEVPDLPNVSEVPNFPLFFGPSRPPPALQFEVQLENEVYTKYHPRKIDFTVRYRIELGFWE